jgi:adenine-specific DNA-methyltransferase
VNSLPSIVASGTALGDVARSRDAAARARRKANGVYYTPPRLAQLLAQWVLAHNPERILEPAFGEGVFLRAAYETLREAGVADPAARLHGVEVDPLGTQRVRESGLELVATQLHQADLLSLDAEQLGGGFNAILGNPPYIRHHLLTEKLIARGRAGASRLGIELNGRSDAWAYFCAHLVTFLDAGGRLALVLPGSVLQADYARPLLNALATDKGEVQLIRVTERLFPGVQERTVLLLMDRGKNSGGRVVYRRIADLAGLKRALMRQAPSSRSRPSERKSRSGSREQRLPWRLTRAETSVWDELSANEFISSLGMLAKIRIGVVTGANGFFIRSDREVGEMGKAVASVPIVARGAWLKVVRWNVAAQADVSDRRSRLVIFPRSERGLTMATRAELRRAEREKIHLKSHCARRSPWQSIVDTAVPDVFLPYMGSQPRWLVVNEASATCSNAIHRVWLKQDTKLSAETLAAASWTTLYRLSAELLGRSYGGGVLKLEPTGAAGILLPAVESPGLLEEIEAVFRARGRDAAQVVADKHLLIDRLGVTRSQLVVLRGAAVRLEALRRR